MKQIQIKWSLKEEKILRDNYGKINYNEISKLLKDRTIFQIRNKCNYMGLCSKNNLRRYSINKEYFKIPTVQNCYWAGFIASDGNISNNRLSIGLAHKDKDLLDNFCKDLSYTNNIKVYKDRVLLSVNCKEIVDDLKSIFNIIPAKSKVLQPPFIKNEDFIASFIKGVIDGDGSIENNRLTIYGTKELLEWVKHYFDIWIPKTNYRLAKVNQIQPYLYSYRIGTNRFEFIYNKLKKLNTYELKRKWSK